MKSAVCIKAGLPKTWWHRRLRSEHGWTCDTDWTNHT